MASSMSATTRPLIQQRPTPTADPFWQSTPRTSPPSVSSLVSAIQKGVPGPVPLPPPVAKAPARRPICTHTTVNRVYGDHACSACGRTPEIGWVYACQQDEQPVPELPLPLGKRDALPDDADYFETTAQIADRIRISPSIIKGIRAGNYSRQQVEQLLAQKEKLLEIIRQKEVQAVKGTPVSFKTTESDSSNIIASVGVSAPLQNDRPSNLPMTPAGTPVNTSTESIASSSVCQVGELTINKCAYKVCQACRPLFDARMYSSFEAVLNGEVPLLTEVESRSLPVMNSAVAANFGMHQTSTLTSIAAEHSKDLTTRDGHDTDDDISVDWSPSGSTDCLSEYSRQFYPCPGPLRCPVYSRNSGCAYDMGFEDGQRAANHGFLSKNDIESYDREHSRQSLLMTETSSTLSSVSLPTMPSTPLNSKDEAFVANPNPQRKLGNAISKDFPIAEVRTKDSNSSFGSDIPQDRIMFANPNPKRKLGRIPSTDYLSTGVRTQHSNSSFGGEVEVRGGLAFTEEAVACSVPDILTD